MTLRVVPRSEWGARPWRSEPETVPASARRNFMIHYDGGAPVSEVGVSVPRRIDAAHQGRGWAGIGYNFVVTQAGTCYEGRGWGLVGAHCEGRNTDSIGVQVAVGGDQVPTPAALAVVRDLYAEACRRAARDLTRTWHGAHYATACPGPRLRAWVQAGMPAPSVTASPLEDDMQLSDLSSWDVSKLVGLKPGSLNFQTLIARVYMATVLPKPMDIDYDALAAALDARGITVDNAAVAEALTAELAKRLAD